MYNSVLFLPLTRFTDALSYMLGCKVSQRSFSYGMNSSVERRLANISQYRNKFIVLLAKAGKTDQAFHVITVPSSVELDKDILTNTSSKGQLHITDKKLTL